MIYTIQYYKDNISDKIIITPLYFLYVLFFFQSTFCIKQSCAVLYLVTQLCPTLCDLMDCSLQFSLSLGFSSQENWSGLLCPPPGDLPNPGIEPRSPTLQVDSLLSELPGLSRSFLHFLVASTRIQKQESAHLQRDEYFSVFL